MPQQTAIEKLMQTIEFWNINIDCPNLFKAICDQALELEKQQIQNAFLEGVKTAKDLELEKFYNTYLKNKQ